MHQRYAAGRYPSRCGDSVTALRLWALLAGLCLGPAAVSAADSEDLFTRAVRHYNQSEYTRARELLERAVELAPETGRYHHWLGRTYGRLARHSNWFRAISLSQKARESLETAVRLDPANVDALRSLMNYYRNAPAFLGGDEDKAAELGRRLQELQSKQARDPEPTPAEGPS